MVGHREDALAYLDEARVRNGWEGVTAYASQATAHAVLALLDYLQQDDTQERAEINNELNDLRRIARNYEQLVATLRADLKGAYAALRAREEADAAEMKAQQEANAADLILSEVEDRR